MKLFFGLLVACIVGLVLGSINACHNVNTPPWEGISTEDDTAAPHANPKAVVDQESFDFGVMDTKGTGKHDFVFSNRGDAPLTLKPGGTSCKCTLSKLEKTELAPGESTNVTVEWHPKEIVGHFAQTAKVLTNDPVRPELVLSVSGEVTTAVRPEPKEVVFSHIGMQEAAHADVRLWCYLAGKPLEIEGYKMARESTAKFFAITYEPIAKKDLAQEKNAQTGILMHVTVKPGLPQGPFQQTILVTTNQPAATHVEIPIQGILTGDIVVAGPAWDDEQNALYIGVVKAKTGASRRLLLMVHGKNNADTKFKIVHIEPDYLRATLGKTVQLGTAQTNMGDGPHVSQTPLTVEVPANSPQESHLGSEQGLSGIILLETTHPQVPQLKIRVRFAVEGGS